MNEIITGIGPKNTIEKLWKVTSIGGYEADHSLTIDISKRYIIYCWIYKDELVSSDICTFTYGIQGAVLKNSNGSYQVDPKFINNGVFSPSGNLNSYVGEWLLSIGFIFPSTTVNTATTYSGIYDLSGERVLEGIDYRWSADPTPWAGETILQGNSSSEVLYIARPSIYEYDSIKGPFIENILGI